MMGFRPSPTRHWRSYGADPLPTPAEALAEPFAAFLSWFLRIECDRCGKTVMHNEAHAARWRERTLADIVHRGPKTTVRGTARRPHRHLGHRTARLRPLVHCAHQPPASEGSLCIGAMLVLCGDPGPPQSRHRPRGVGAAGAAAPRSPPPPAVPGAAQAAPSPSGPHQHAAAPLRRAAPLEPLPSLGRRCAGLAQRIACWRPPPLAEPSIRLTLRARCFA
jgi:hypothetical protein